MISETDIHAVSKAFIEIVTQLETQHEVIKSLTLRVTSLEEQVHDLKFPNG